MRNCVLFFVFLTACTSSEDSVTQSGKVEESPCSEEDVCRLTNGQSGIAICHVPPGNEENPLSLCVGEPSVAAGHFKNHEEDSCGACEPPDDSGDDEEEVLPDAGVPEETPPDAGTDEQCPTGVGGCYFCSNCECVNFCEPPVECTDPNGCGDA